MSQVYKLAIVGAGVSGLYTAWRMCMDTKSVDPQDIVILEQSNRTGGRLFTWTLNDFDPSFPDDPSVRAELGGMRILNYNLYTYSLALELKLDLVSFPADVPDNWHYLRGSVLQTKDYPKQTIYALSEQERGWTPGDVVYNSLVTNSNIVPPSQFPDDEGKISQRDFVNWVMTNTTYQGQPSYEYGFWNALVGSGQYQNPNTSNVSYQAYAYFLEAGAYDTIPSNWNASVAFSNALSDFSNNPTYWAIKDGYQQLPNALADALAAAGTDMIRLNTQVKNVQYVGGTFIVEAVQDGRPVTFQAENLVLALPPRALQILANAPGCLMNQPKHKALLEQAAPVPLLKIFLVYDQDWWTGSVGEWTQFTRMTTDMPMRQIYYFGSQTANGKTYYLFQAAYNDGLKAGYWSGLMPEEAKKKGQDLDTDIFGHIYNMTGENTIETGMLGFDTTQNVSDFPMFSTVHEQFVTMVQNVALARNPNATVKAAQPIAGAAMNWATDPFGGGVNFWNVGVDIGSSGNSAYWSVMNPLPGTPMYIVGEGYSLYQGWVEGALWSAEDMLTKFFGLTRPGWLQSKPYAPPSAPPPSPVTAQKVPSPAG